MGGGFVRGFLARDRILPFLVALVAPQKVNKGIYIQNLEKGKETKLRASV